MRETNPELETPEVPVDRNTEVMAGGVGQPAHVDESAQKSERTIAVCRLALSISAFAIIFVDPRQPLYGSSALYILLGTYIVHSAALLWAFSREKLLAATAAKAVLLADVAWFTAIVALSAGGPNPFFLFYVFAVVSAGARWGMRTTVRVALGAALLYLVVVVGSRWWFLGSEFTVRSAYILRPTYLLILGYLVGFIGEHELSAKRRLIEIIALQNAVGRSRAPMTMLVRLVHRLVAFFAADYVLLQLRTGDGDGIEWEGRAKRGHALVLRSVPPTSWTPASSGGLSYRLSHVIGNWGRRVECMSPSDNVPNRVVETEEPAFLARPRARTLISIPIGAPAGARGRLILGRTRSNFSRDDLAFCRTLAAQGAILIDNAMLQQAAEELAVAEERTRIARDIHDGFVQSLAALDVRIEVCRKLEQKDPERLPGELADLQGNIKQGYQDARRYLDKLRKGSEAGPDVDSAMEEIVREFRKKADSKIELHSSAEGVPAQHGIGFELLQIVREGLTNISRHARAEHAMVSVEARPRDFQVTIRDDGCGFPVAAGGMNGELPSSAAPWSIRERVEALQGSLSITSSVGGGSEIRITLPRNGN